MHHHNQAKPSSFNTIRHIFKHKKEKKQPPTPRTRQKKQQGKSQLKPSTTNSEPNMRAFVERQPDWMDGVLVYAEG